MGRADEATAQGWMRGGGREGGREGWGLCPTTARGMQAGIFNCCTLHDCHCLTFPFQAMSCSSQDESWADPTAIYAFGGCDITQ